MTGASIASLPLCACCGWPAVPRVLSSDGDAVLCLVCQVAGCTADAVGPGVERPETHRFVRESLAGGRTDHAQPGRVAAAHLPDLAVARARIAASIEGRRLREHTPDQEERAARLLTELWLAGERHGITPDTWTWVASLPDAALDAVSWQDHTGRAG